MKIVEKYTALLTMEKAQVVKKSGDGGDGEPPAKKSKEGEPSTSEQSPEEEDMVKSVVRFEDKVLGRKPTKRKAPFKGGKHTAEVFGLQNLSEVRAPGVFGVEWKLPHQACSQRWHLFLEICFGADSLSS